MRPYGVSNNSSDRLTRPLVREGGALREASWDEALDRVVARLRELLAEKGPGRARLLQQRAALPGGLLLALESYAKAADSAPALPDPDAELGLVADLRILYRLAQECLIGQAIVRQGAVAARDRTLLESVDSWSRETEVQARWLKTRLKTAAPQTLTVA